MIGSLRDRVEILRPLRISDGGGGYVVSYDTLGTVAARAESRRAATDRAVEPERMRLKTRFVMRRRDDLVFEMRLVHRGRRYRITDIQDRDDAGRFTVVQGEEISA